MTPSNEIRHFWLVLGGPNHTTAVGPGGTHFFFTGKGSYGWVLTPSNEIRHFLGTVFFLGGGPNQTSHFFGLICVQLVLNNKITLN